MATDFSSAYARLNPAQKQAVDTIDGPVMVVAGPGTGKTQVLAARIANILQKTDTQPHNILALTFTESAAKNMRERVVQLIGRAGYYVQISTFHAFCQEVIATHPEFFPIDRDSVALSDLERYDLFETLITQNSGLELLKPINRPLFYVRDCIRAISQLKREGITPEQLVELIDADDQRLTADGDTLKKAERAQAEKNLAKQRELAIIYNAYEGRLREQLRYDFDDMIALVARAFATQELLLLEYQENLHYFLVDEYQDTNSAQNQVVDLLASYWGEQANVCVVGDPHQAIYRFQGASVENVVGFAQRYPQATLITLTWGYRCVQPIYDSAFSLISHNALTKAGFVTQNGQAPDQLAGALSAKLRSVQRTATKDANQPPVPIVLQFAPSQTLELINVAQRIAQLQNEGVPLDEIAVLYRHNADAIELSAVLARSGIPFEIDGGSNVLESETVRQLLSLFSLVHELRSGATDERVFEVFSYPWLNIEKLSVLKLVQLAAHEKRSMLSLIEKHDDVAYTITAEQWNALVGLVHKLEGWSTLDASVTFPAWFAQVIQESGFIDWVLAQVERPQLLVYLNSVFNQVKSLASGNKGLKLGDFLAAVRTMIEHGIAITAEDLNARGGAVRLSTAHRAKGQEWQYVFVIHCLDGKWGNNRSRDLLPLPQGVLKNTDLSKKERNEDERRLFYVTLTRAKLQVMVSYPQTVITNNRSKEVVRSMFLEELSDDALLIESVMDQGLQAELALQSVFAAPLQQPILEKPQTTAQRDFFAQLVANFRLSVTALNAYLRDPREFALNYLLRLPRAKPEHMAFGTAIHQSLERLYKHLRETGEPLPLESVLHTYQESLTRELLTSQDFDRRLRYGRTMLERYYQQLDTQAAPLFLERSFGSGTSTTVLDTPSGPIHLTGRIDRVDWLDREHKTVRVIDYKTGKTKSINDILGATVAAGLSEREQGLPEQIRGPYKRQLLFYKLLADTDNSFIPTVREGIFEFVEPDVKTGAVIQRRFDLPDEEVELLKQLIFEVFSEIRALVFLDAI